MSTGEHKGAEITNHRLANTQAIPHSNRADGIATELLQPRKIRRNILGKKA